MYEDTEKFIDLDFEQQVRRAAYHLWEDDGRPFGEEKRYWFLALSRLLEQRSSPPSDLTSAESQVHSPRAQPGI